MSAELLARLIDAGTPAQLVAEVALELGKAAAAQSAIDARRKADRDRQAARRVSRDITLGHVMSEDSADVTAPAPSPSLSPPNPQTPTPIPVGGEPRAREDLPIELRTALALATLAAIIDLCRQRRWKSMPPPGGVGDEQWQGFLDHRRAKRETLTPRAYSLLCAKLVKLAEDGWPPGDLIDTAVERGWVTVFAPREFTNGRDRQTGKSIEGHSNPMVRSVIAAEARRAADGS